MSTMQGASHTRYSYVCLVSRLGLHGYGELSSSMVMEMGAPRLETSRHGDGSRVFREIDLGCVFLTTFGELQQKMLHARMK